MGVYVAFTGSSSQGEAGVQCNVARTHYAPLREQMIFANEVVLQKGQVVLVPQGFWKRKHPAASKADRLASAFFFGVLSERGRHLILHFRTGRGGRDFDLPSHGSLRAVESSLPRIGGAFRKRKLRPSLFFVLSRNNLGSEEPSSGGNQSCALGTRKWFSYRRLSRGR